MHICLCVCVCVSVSSVWKRYRFGAGSHLAAESGTGPSRADAEQVLGGDGVKPNQLP